MEQFLKCTFDELDEVDGLTVFGKGLNIQKLFSMFVHQACLRRKTVVCINANEWVSHVQHYLKKENLHPVMLPKVTSKVKQNS